MNNSQFRRLLFDAPDNNNNSDAASSTKQASAPSSTLGAKKSSFMPMTPRAVKGSTVADVDFARQVRERNAAFQPPPAKKFKTSAPKGVKYAAGYVDRAKARAESSGGDEKEARIKALEEQMKLGQISEEVFEGLRDEITGGEVGSTHLVKGLDWRLLERVRRGEDVLKSGTGEDGGGAERMGNVDDELDKLGEKEVEALQREKVEKKGTMAAPAAVAGVKRSRDEIMAELKAQRKAAAEARAEPVLDKRWRKVGEEKSRIQIDHKGREVLITVDEDGVVKKKVRKVPKAATEGEKVPLDMPDESMPVLGSDAVIPQAQQEEPVEVDEDDDIFEGVGTEYNPLGDQEDDDSNDETSEDEGEQPPKGKAVNSEPTVHSKVAKENKQKPDTPNDETKPTPRNYFNDTLSTTEEESTQDRILGVQSLLKKAAKMDSVTSDVNDTNTNENGSTTQDHDQAARLQKRAQMLAQQDRDLEDIDMGFGASRYEDGEDEEGGAKVKLSEWKDNGEDEGEEKRGTKKKRERKPKKRKGDANNIADIMGVIEKRKSGK